MTEPRPVERSSRAAATLEVRWLGHSTTVVDLGGTRVLTDPVLRDRVGHLRRRAGSGIVGSSVDVVVVSHLHHDHLDLPSLRRLPADVPVVVPRGAGRLVAGAAPGEVVEVVVGDTVTVGDVTITAVPADHHPGRFLSRTRAEPLGFVLSGPGVTAYFPGDTDLHPVMADLPAPDVALLPIWGWGPTLGSHHLDPDRAARAAEMLRARSVVPVHWGTFAPLGLGRRPDGWFDRPARWFGDEMRRRIPEVALHLVRPGADPVVIGPSISNEHTARERTARERTARDRTARDRTARDRTARDRTERDRTARDRTARDRMTRDRTEREVPEHGS